MEKETIDSIITEAELCQVLEITKVQVQNLRRKGLPFVTLGRGSRVYLEADILQFLASNTKVLKDSL